VTPRVVLVGPPGAGKTSIGRRLASRWNVGFRDTDADIERVTGSSVSDLFIDRGEAAFRELEKVAVADALAEHEGVLALGGGSILDPGTRALLTRPCVVFLDVGVAQAARRVGFARDRPLLLGNPRAQWMQLMAARRGFYEEVATFTVSTDEGSPDDAVTRIIDGLGARAEEARDA
jgi:shikimate kinase